MWSYLQDEKEICNALVEEMLQLWKRIRVPFLFAGVMPRIARLLEGYNYSPHNETFGSADEAAQFLKNGHPGLVALSLAGIEWGKSLPVPRSRAEKAAEETTEED